MVHARDGAARWLCGATRLREEPIKKEGGTARDGRLINLHVAVHVYISAMSGMSAHAQQLRHHDGGGGGLAARSLLHGAGEGCGGGVGIVVVGGGVGRGGEPLNRGEQLAVQRLLARRHGRQVALVVQHRVA